MKKILLSLIALAFLSCPDAIYAQGPDLGTAADFVIFSANGAVTNTGTSQVTGNVGTNNGATTGFGNVNGVMHTSDGASAACAADLLTAYHQVDTATPNFSHAPLLGNGDTLVPGVYAVVGTTTLNLNLVLDAEGDPDARFIFQVAGTFSANSASEIVMINGLKACNIFWKVEGEVNMAAGTKMKGNVIAHNAAIHMATNVALEGRALSTTGAITLSGTLAYTPTGCGSPVLTGPAAPALGATECYAIFSGNGSVINAGITYVTGDIGTNVGLTTGYNQLFVNGTIHDIPDLSTSACAADLLNLYSYLNTLPDDIELLYPAQFGHGLVLTPHTYLMAAAASFTDTVFLNAEGNPNAVFVIKVNGAFSTSTFSAVALMNGAQAANVFWKVEGEVNINDFSDFKGTIVANAGAINLYTGAVIEGRAMTLTGALSSFSVEANMPPGCAPLPLGWLYFRGNPAGRMVFLEWGTTDEMDNGFFTIETSRDGNAFENLTVVTAQNQPDKAEQHYSYASPSVPGMGYYRISHTDYGGKQNYFRTIQVSTAGSSSTTPYVAGDFIYIQVAGPVSGKGSLSLFDIAGRKVSSQEIVVAGEMNAYKAQRPEQPGIYLLYLECGGQKLYSGKIIVE